MKDAYIKKAMPDPLLRDYISMYTFVDIPFMQTQQLEFKVMPSSHTRMILFLDEPSLHEVKNTLQPVDRYSLTGFVSKPHLFIPNGNLQQVMIHFTAWGIQPFVNFPISEITDSRVALSYIFKQELESLGANLHCGLTLQERVITLNTFFLKHLQKARQIDYRAKTLTKYILQCNGTLRLQEVSKNLYIGERTVQRIIHNAIGVNYKFFTKLVRLDYVRRLMTKEVATLTEVALQSGYFDQAHFIHDFRASFGESPRTYLKRHQKLIWNKIAT